MGNLSRRAQIYILTVLGLGAVLFLWRMPEIFREDVPWLAWVVLAILASFAQLFKVTTPKHQNYNTSLAFFFAAVLLLQPGPLILLVVVAHIPEWIRFRYAWYIQSFNIAAHIVGALLAKAIYLLLVGSAGLLSMQGVLAALAAVGGFTVVNHILVAVVLLLARGISLRESGTLELDNLLTDFVLLCLGGSVAILWNLNPWLIILASSPLLLIYRSFNIPTLKEEARIDAKTGVYNIKHFAQVLNEELRRAARFDRPLAVIMADLDLLRNINNSYGHLAGDIVLKGVAEIIKSNLREYDLPARFGGEEFAILLPEADSQEAYLVADRIRKEVERARFEVATSDLPIKATISLGVAHFPEHGREANEVIHQADLAVYQAKLGGRNRVCIASDISLKLEMLRGFEGSHRLPLIDSEAGRRSPKSHEPPGGKGGRPLNGGPERWSWPMMIFLGLVIAGGLAITALYLPQAPQDDWRGIVLFTGLGILAELFALDLYGGSSVSLSFVLIFVAALFYGVDGVVFISPFVALAHAIKFRNVGYKALFNVSAYILSGSLAASIFWAFGYSLEVRNLPYLILPTMLAALGNYLLNSGLVAMVIALGTEESPLSVWNERFRWLLGHYTFLGLLGLLVALAYASFGFYGLVAFVAPLLVVRYSQMQYIKRTLSSVAELKKVNEELIKASEQIGTINQELFETLAQMIDSRDPFVYGHSQRVAEYAVAVAKELGLPEKRVELVRRAALVHDIGKIGISERILYKPTKLTPQESIYAQSHTTLGAEFLEGCHSLRDIIPYVKYHHEWFDGHGYPEGLVGEEIPLEARIMGLCDAVEAMASDRPYHQGMPVSKIIVELRRGAGSQFDPRIVEAFVRVAQREGDRLIVNTARRLREEREGLAEELGAFDFAAHTHTMGG
ncbi:MAG: diguanylate cyclase [Anaerolineae bacterium]